MNIKTAAFYVKFAEYEQRFERKQGYFPPIMKEVVEKSLDCGNPVERGLFFLKRLLLEIFFQELGSVGFF